ncbi:GH39 family glycosyl hydrolase [Paractinoplanes brasiliensis]|uniref:Xylan 1,4-beta-xylosidase n=1 Tax=Paractinoplanes brasiliensis TaxID=52695 RepID=A0A4R6J8P7_9ACTN|nr:xylan 1,4-beta-xylosidase [Actinoplanes brasiliensis]TDO31949.1 xylan 1,4-beta-xylosidase [Actinoplanes brasiliensis]GID27993.1 beta-xylosidase [Actinoplanes brasiliensis]
MTIEDQARSSWAALMGGGGAQDRTPGKPQQSQLPAPAGVTAVTGRGLVTVNWEPVPGAIGYAVHRSSSPDGPFEVVDHGGGDVLAVPHGPYADTTPGRGGWYAVAALETVTAIGPLSVPVPASGGDVSGVAVVTLGDLEAPLPRVWEAMVGSEHLSHLLSTDQTGGHVIGPDLAAALRRVASELGVRTVRAHHILGDDNGVYREVDGEPVYDFTRVDQIFDLVRDLGLTPVVEFGFMPRDLARDPSRTVFTYQGIISPPRDWDRWGDLIGAFTRHVVDRYGLDEVREHWWFEVWNEANLSVFWSGTPDEYWQLFEVTVAAVKDVDPGLRVGGPATAAVGWVEDQPGGDFLSTHVYGTVPLDLRPLAGGRALLWTEWGVTATHGSRINDSVFAAAFLLKGMRSAAGRIDALAPWVASDHFEELGRPQRLLHGGFGLLTVGNLAKPKFWALALAARLGPVELPVTVTGDGLVEAWASRYDDGGTGILLWNSTLDHGQVNGSAALSRTVVVRPGSAAPHRLRVWRVDSTHGVIDFDGEWPTPSQWQALRAADRLDEAEPARRLPPGADVTIELPNPGIAFLELRPL